MDMDYLAKGSLE